ncbi:MAG TPA: hypothetical protein VLH84_02545 [Patescibacteria group bacterium]|nr:hypothetical protein [Patescibacteria group bacterium]
MTAKRSQPNLITDFRPAKQSVSHPKLGKKFLKKNLKLAAATVALITVIVVITLILAIKHVSSDKKELTRVKAQVGALMILPTDEEPTLASVTDKAKLTNLFLKSKAENGDKVLIYVKNHTVIIYRPGVNKIAAVGTVTSDPALPEAKGATITVMDGADDPAKTQAVIANIQAAYPDLKVTDGGMSNRHDFPTTIVIDNTNQKDNLVDALAKITSGKRGVVPLSEGTASTDLEIIVGKDT